MRSCRRGAAAMPKVLCYLPGLEGGGAERTMVNLANELPAQGWQVKLAVGRATGGARDWLAPHTEVVDLAVQRSRQAPLRLRRLIRDWQPDVVFSTLIDGNVAARVACLGLRHRPALVVRETNSHLARGDLPGWLTRIAGWAYRGADHLVALSSGVGQEMIRSYHLSPQRVTVIPNPVDTTALRQQADAARAAPPPWGADSSRPVVVGMGRLHRQKGFERLIEAVALLPADQRPRVAILGDGSLREALSAQAQALGVDLLLPGFVRSPAAWLAHAAAFVLSSRWEGFGHVLVEAMACGAPVLSFDCPYGPRDIILSGQNGLLLPEGDCPALASALSGLLSSPEQQQGLQQGGYAALPNYDLSAITGRYAALLAAILNGKKR